MATKRGNVRERILNAIIEYKRKNEGMSPSYREIGEKVGISAVGHIAFHLDALEDNGYIKREKNRSRSIKVLRQYDCTRESEQFPVAAGPQRAIMDVIEQVEQVYPKTAFMLLVEGESMIEDGIHSGDYIVVEPGQSINDGDIAVVTHLLENGSNAGGATIKRLYKEEGRIRLQPSNEHMAPWYVDAEEWNKEWMVQGKVIAVIHQF